VQRKNKKTKKYHKKIKIRRKMITKTIGKIYNYTISIKKTPFQFIICIIITGESWLFTTAVTWSIYK
jgi:hypothetical protein